MFLIAKSALGDPLRARAGPFLKRMEAGFREDAFNYLLVLRLIPLFPFWIVNLVPAFLGVPLRTYVLGTFIGIIPGSFVFASVGAGIGSVLDSGQEFSPASVLTPQIVIALVGLALLALLPVVYRKLKARPARELKPPQTTSTRRSPTPSICAMEDVAALDRADAGRRAGEDQIAGCQREQAGQVGDDLGRLPDHLREIAVLAQLAVDLEPDGAARRMADRARRRQRRAGRRMVERLGDRPGPAHLAGFLLAVAPGHVEADRIAEDVLQSPFGGDVARRPRPAPPPARARSARSRTRSDRGTRRRPGSAAPAGLVKKNGGSRSGSWPISRACSA